MDSVGLLCRMDFVPHSSSKCFPWLLAEPRIHSSVDHRLLPSDSEEYSEVEEGEGIGQTDHTVQDLPGLATG
jgi:hypothetical protein